MRIKVLLECIKVQNKKRYIEYVKNFDYKRALAEDPLTKRDKFQNNEDPFVTNIDNITSYRDFHKQITNKFKLSNIATDNSDFEKVLQILNWLKEHTFYNGAQIIPICDNTLDILNYSFDKPFKNAINCRLKAIAFADCLVAVGIKAYPVCMISTKFKSCHFTCQAYISELDKWCVFDPSFGCWFSNSNGTPIDIFEMRELFLKNIEPTVNGYNFNGTNECFDVYVNSFLKLCISNLTTWQDNSTDRRTKRKLSKKKEFKSKIPN